MRFAFLVLLSVLEFGSSAILSTRPRIGVNIPLKKRASLTDENGVVDVQALRNQLVRVSNKLHRGFHAFQKNTGSFHPNDARRTAKRQTGSDALIDDNGSLWHGTITVGTPPVEFIVDFDTGSSDLFLPGNLCTINCDGHTIYDTDGSSTAKAIGQKFQLSFGDGSTVTGNLFLDTVTIANLTATGQAVGAATKYSKGFSIDQFLPDGLMGLAFPEISDFGFDPVFQTLVGQNSTTAPQFAFKLATTGSELFLGGVNPTLFNGSIAQTPVVQQGFWQVDLEAVNVGGEAVTSSLSAIIDTGTTLVLGDLDTVTSMYAAIPGSRDASTTIGDGFFTFPCDSTPDISLTFGGQSFAISPETFNLGIVSQGSTDCVGGIAAFENNFWLVGDVFLQNVYTVFDAGNTTVGFANLA